jgi:flagellar biosynthesis protein FlhF
MREALARVRHDLGGDAVILATRDVRQKRLFGLGRARPMVEVEARAAAKGEVVPASRTVAAGLDRARDAAPAPAVPAPGALTDELRRLHAMVEQLSRHGRVEHLLPELPSALAGPYAELVEADVPEPLARQLVRLAADEVDPAEHHRSDALRAAVRRAVEAALPIAPPVALVPGTRRIVALVGPTGVGKTTTVAKLAASFKLVHNVDIGLVTVDTYRIAAVEQLKTYADIIDIPLVVANSPDEMPGALEALTGADLVLIDTAGRSPRDEVRIRELGEFLAAAVPDEVHLVLSATAGEKSLRSALERFATVRADRLILTKLDEAEGLGGLLGVISQAGRPVSYLTTGQAVPDDIEPADRARLTRLILGDEVVS